MAGNTSKNSRRGNHEGSIRYREGRNNWQAQITVRGKRATKSFQTRSEAQKWLREMQNSMENGMTAQVARSSLKDALKVWMDEGKKGWEIKTYQQYDQIVRNHILPHVKKNLKVMDVKPFHVQELVNIAEENGVGIRTRKYILSTLHTFFEDLCFQKVFQYNPAHGIKIAYEPSEMKTLNAEQVNKLLEAAKTSRFEILYYLAVTTGMRQGELLGLKWSDVDWASHSILVQRQVQWVEREKDDPSPRYIFKSPKSKAGNRRIALGVTAVEKLRTQKNRLAMQHLISGEKWEELDLVFPNLVGRPVEPTNLIRDFKKVLEIARLPKIRFHDLRHTSATLMLLMNVHPKIVSERLGHSDIQITLQLYSHAIPTLQTEAAAKLDDLLNLSPFDQDRSTVEVNQFEETLNL